MCGICGVVRFNGDPVDPARLNRACRELKHRGPDHTGTWTDASPRGSVGLGLSLGWDTVYFDVAHGVRGGGWEAVFSVSEQFQGWM